MGRIRQAARATVNAVLKVAGLEIRKVARPNDQRAFYTVSASCQISNLATLYSQKLGERFHGFFVEVGAYDGESFSNTSCLADKGWSGLLIEPVPEFAAQAAARHASNPGVRVIQKAVGREAGEVRISIAGALSSCSPEMVAEYRGIDWAQASLGGDTIAVPQVRLDDLLAEQAVAPRFDVLVIDTEGFESEVIAGFTIGRWMPKLIIIELADFHPDITCRRGEDDCILRQIIAAGYEIIYKDAINTVFSCCAE